MKVFEKLVFPNGSYVPNRIAKAAMEENMADLNHAPSEELMRLYQAWANGGVGLIITGNVMVDRRAMTGPGGVVLEDEKHLDTFKKWAQIERFLLNLIKFHLDNNYKKQRFINCV